MSKDLFGRAHINGRQYDLFGKQKDEFHWICAQFSGDGATQVIKRANEKNLKTFYPVRKTFDGDYVPMWRSYLFIEHCEGITINLCRTTSHFIKIISERDEDGVQHPVLVPRGANQENLRMVMMGKFDDTQFKRQFYGKGSIVSVLEGVFIDKKVRLEIDIPPDMNARTRVPVDINGIKAKIEIFRLSL
jgi:hypothetical protein